MIRHATTNEMNKYMELVPPGIDKDEYLKMLKTTQLYFPSDDEIKKSAEHIHMDIDEYAKIVKKDAIPIVHNMCADFDGDEIPSFFNRDTKSIESNDIGSTREKYQSLLNNLREKRIKKN